MVVIRPYQPGDEQGMCEAHIAAVRDICAKNYTPQQIRLWLEGRHPNDYLHSISQNSEHFWVLDDAGHIGGFGGWHGNQINHLYMHPRYAGQGWGRKLYEQIEGDFFANSGYNICRIASTVTAKKFYEHMGAEVVKMGIQLMHDGKTRVSAWHLQKTQHLQKTAARPLAN